MNRSVLLGTLLLVLASAPVATAKPDLPGLNDCDGSNVCVVARADPACVGVGFGLQGVAACVRENCVYVVFGITREPVCLESSGAAPDRCETYGVCGGPVLVRNHEGVCAGYANPYGGTLACLDRDEGVCVVSAGEFWYDRECVGQLTTLP